MRHLALQLSCVALLAAGVPAASAFDNIAVGDTATGVNTTAISLGSFISCSGSTLAGTVASDAGTDAGGTADLSTVTFTGCTGPFGTAATETANNLPWHLSVDGTGAGTLSGVDLTQQWGTTICRYTGTIQFIYDAADWGGTGDAPLSGSLTRISSNTTLCTSPAAVSGTYNVVGPSGVIDL